MGILEDLQSNSKIVMAVIVLFVGGIINHYWFADNFFGLLVIGAAIIFILARGDEDYRLMDTIDAMKYATIHDADKLAKLGLKDVSETFFGDGYAITNATGDKGIWASEVVEVGNDRILKKIIGFDLRTDFLKRRTGVITSWSNTPMTEKNALRLLCPDSSEVKRDVAWSTVANELGVPVEELRRLGSKLSLARKGEDVEVE